MDKNSNIDAVDYNIDEVDKISISVLQCTFRVSEPMTVLNTRFKSFRLLTNFWIMIVTHSSKFEIFSESKPLKSTFEFDSKTSSTIF